MVDMEGVILTLFIVGAPFCTATPVEDTDVSSESLTLYTHATISPGETVEGSKVRLEPDPKETPVVWFSHV